MDLGLWNKVALVAGASDGLGYAAARELAREGARVAILARNEGSLQAAANEIANETGSEVIAVVADVTNRAAVTRAISSTLGRFGELHILVTNSGGGASGPFDRVSDEQWREGWELNFFSHVTLIKQALPAMRRAGWGRIITISSLTVKLPLADLAISSTVRPGLSGLVRLLATELAPEGITVNNLAPGYTATDRVQHIFEEKAARDGISIEEAQAGIVSQIPARRMASPEEQGAVVAFLASERASFITGQTILVDGGQYLGIL